MGGLVDRPRSFSMDELVSLPSVTITTTLASVGALFWLSS